MTQTSPRRGASNLPHPLGAWIVRLQRQLSDRLFAKGDAFARGQGWEITKSTGRFGLGARIYRDPRFVQDAETRHGKECAGLRSDAR
jgi:hypothetical protein